MDSAIFSESMMPVDAKPAKVPPHSKEAEQSVLGALMLDARAWDKVSDRVSVDDFYAEFNRHLFQAMLTLSERRQPIDVLTVADALKAQGNALRPEDEAYIYGLANNTPSSANVAAYADIVRERAILRLLIETGSDISERAFLNEGSDIKELLDAAERQVFNIAEKRQRHNGPKDIGSVLALATERIDQLYENKGQLSGLSSGFSDVDDMTSGFQVGDLVIIAGRPSMGKTAISMNMAEHAAIKGDKPVLVFSMEMPAEALALRMISSLGRIDQHKVRTGQLEDDDWPRVTSAIEILSTSKLYIDDTPALTPVEMRSRARRLAREHGNLGMIVVDYLQLMQVAGARENRTNEISEISRSLKALAKELSVPVVALSQLNRSLESRTDKRPMMSDLRESGAIEQDADLIGFIYRDEVYHPDTPDKGRAEFIIAKQRNGPTGRVILTFLGEFTRFEDYIQDSVMGR